MKRYLWSPLHSNRSALKYTIDSGIWWAICTGFIWFACCLYLCRMNRLMALWLWLYILFWWDLFYYYVFVIQGTFIMHGTFCLIVYSSIFKWWNFCFVPCWCTVYVSCSKFEWLKNKKIKIPKYCLNNQTCDIFLASQWWCRLINWSDNSVCLADSGVNLNEWKHSKWRAQCRHREVTVKSLVLQDYSRP